MNRKIRLDCDGKTAREVIQGLVREFEAPRNGRRVVLLVDNVGRINDSLPRLLRQVLDFFHEREILAAIVDPTGCAATLFRTLGGSVHVQVCRSESEVLAPMDILVVEDTPDSLDFVRTLLETAGHRVETATTGAEAIRVCESRSFDLVLLDMVLPDTDGMAVATRLAGRKVPLIAMSAFLDRWAPADFRRAGFRRELRKPFKVADLLAALGA